MKFKIGQKCKFQDESLARFSTGLKLGGPLFLAKLAMEENLLPMDIAMLLELSQQNNKVVEVVEIISKSKEDILSPEDAASTPEEDILYGVRMPGLRQGMIVGTTSNTLTAIGEWKDDKPAEDKDFLNKILPDVGFDNDTKH